MNSRLVSENAFILLVVFGLGLLITCALSLRSRLQNGATFDQLRYSGWYEVTPIRAVLYSVFLLLWGLCIGSALLTVSHVFKCFDEGFGRHGQQIFFYGVSSGLLCWVANLWHLIALNKGTNEPPHVSVGGVMIGSRIDRDALASLGSERFPNFVDSAWKVEVKARVIMLACGALLIAWTLWESNDGLPGPAAALTMVMPLLKQLPQAVGLIVLWSSAIVFGTTLWTNREYLLLPFRSAVVLLGVTWCTGIVGYAIIAEPGDIAAALGWSLAAVCWRWYVDLRTLRSYRKQQDVAQPIIADISRAVPGLKNLRRRADCALAPLDENEISGRLTSGCRNVESASLLVIRNFARFMRLATVDHEHFVTAQLRFLTVRRFVTENCCGGTSRWFQDPVVPVWNEELFPLHVPAGYVNLMDPLGLGCSWDKVCQCSPCGGSGEVSCGTCGGSGRVTRRENDKDVTYTCSNCGGRGKVTCGTCSGHGRLVFNRTLNTQWLRLLPGCLDPHVPMPELMEDAEERVYYRKPFVEDRKKISQVATTEGIEADLQVELDSAVEALRLKHDAHASCVSKLHDGKLYRADFQVTGHWTLKIGFSGLPGKLGWFFGHRPEFYFPKLPLAWDTVVTGITLPPTVVVCLLVLTQWVSALVRCVDGW